MQLRLKVIEVTQERCRLCCLLCASLGCGVWTNDVRRYHRARLAGYCSVSSSRAADRGALKLARSGRVAVVVVVKEEGEGARFRGERKVI